MPIKREDAHRALELLEQYRDRLTKSQDRPLRTSIERLIDVFRGRLFHALLDVQEYYELTLLNDTRSVKQPSTQDTHSSLPKWDMDSHFTSNDLMSSSKIYSQHNMSEEPLPLPPMPSSPLPPPPVEVAFAQQNGSASQWEHEEITLERGPAGLGFSIAGGSDIPHIGKDPSIYVTKLIDGGTAIADGRLRTNDIILSVNGVSTVNVTHAQSVDALKRAGKVVHLKVKRPLNRLEDIQEIELTKDSRGLGFSIAGGIGNQHVPGDNGIFVTKVIDGGAAQKDGRLAVGDRLLAVNDVDLVDVAHEAAVAALKATKEHVRLVVSKPDVSTVDGQLSPDVSIKEKQDKQEKPAPPANHAEVNNQAPRKAGGAKKTPKGPRKITLRKGPTGLGFNIVGGEDGEGIFVSSILPGGPADLSGELLKGDQLISVNGIDIREATHEQAAAALKGAGDVVEMIAQYKPNEYARFEAKINELREQMMIASTGSLPRTEKKRGLFVRALFDYDMSGDSELQGQVINFRFGDVLHVLSGGDEDDWWQAQKVFPEEDAVAYIPSRHRAEEFERKRKRDQMTGKKKKGKKTKKGKEQASMDEQSGEDGDEHVLTYETVIRKELNYVRPVIIMGPLKDQINDDLISEFPDAFGSCIPHTTRPQRENEVNGRDYHFVASREQMERDIENHLFIEAGQFSENLYGTSIQSVKDVSEQGKHCILDVSGSAIARLQAAQLYPIVIFIRPKSSEVIVQWNSGEMSLVQAQKTLDKALKMEKEFGESFTAVVNEESVDDVYSEVKRIIEMHSSESVVWIPDNE